MKHELRFHMRSWNSRGGVLPSREKKDRVMRSGPCLSRERRRNVETVESLLEERRLNSMIVSLHLQRLSLICGRRVGFCFREELDRVLEMSFLYPGEGTE